MSQDRKDGGQAFPLYDYTLRGMTLRDFFAAAALQGQLASPRNDEVPRTTLIAYAYQMADEMLKVRDK